MKIFFITFIILYISSSALVLSENIKTKIKIFSITNDKINFKHQIETYNLDNSLNVVIEKPSGSIEKWEVNQTGEAIELDIKNNDFGHINYLGYPANYGFVPKTFLPASIGGDDDLVNAIVLGSQLQTGQIVRCNVIGMLNINDQNSIDNIVVCIEKTSFLNKFNSIKDLKSMSPGILEIIEIWFKNYKEEYVEILDYSSKKNTFTFINDSKKFYNKEIKKKLK